jgi:hypothetical protein
MSGSGVLILKVEDDPDSYEISSAVPSALAVQGFVVTRMKELMCGLLFSMVLITPLLN